jgi:hypothetical protein
MSKLLPILALAGSLSAQTLVVDRGLAASRGVPEPVERGEGQGFLGNSFKVGAKGETWVLDTPRVWAAAGDAKPCPKAPGDRVEKIVLLGALDKPPVAGQPACACHALVQIASATLEPGASAPANSSLKLAAEGDLWRLNFENLRRSVPGGMDVLFAVRATGRAEAEACTAGKSWSLSASPGRRVAPVYLRQGRLGGWLQRQGPAVLVECESLGAPCPVGRAEEK